MRPKQGQRSGYSKQSSARKVLCGEQEIYMMFGMRVQITRCRPGISGEAIGVCVYRLQRCSDDWFQISLATAAVESRCDAVVLGLTYLFPALSFAGDSLFRPCPVFTPRSSNRACRFAAPGSLGSITISPTKSCASALLAG
jgi:hypothetical protein